MKRSALQVVPPLAAHHCALALDLVAADFRAASDSTLAST